MKKLSVALISLSLLTSAFSSVQAAEKALSVGLNGEQIRFSKSAPIIEKGVTLVPMRILLEKLGVQVKWDQATRTVSGSKEGLSFSLKIGSTNATANGKAVKLDVAPKQIGNETYVPLRFAAETAGYQVAWNPSLHQVMLTSGKQSEGSHGFMWKVENKGNTVYLLGTVHVADDSMYPLRPEIERALNDADDLSVEVDMSKIDPKEVQQQLMELGFYKDGDTLSNHVSAETYAKLKSFLNAREMPENSFDNLKPWVIQGQISYSNIADDGLETGMGIDLYLINKANKAKKPVISLETTEGNYRLNNSYSDALQERILLLALDPKSVVPPAPDVPVDFFPKIWKEGDYNALAEASKSTGWDPEYYKGIMSDRNVAMFEKIKDYLNSDKKQTHLVAVGSGHMLGDKGIVPLLEQAGFKVKKH
ncbi:TraB/GumN family protein [Paenibacillus sp. NPDC056722]|uniref:TraB/GumN family protein n=1 Tax=Paenibacillus sp. NPDC056722 TaxID=3345924 RepID=UPI003697EC5D